MILQANKEKVDHVGKHEGFSGKHREVFHPFDKKSGSGRGKEVPKGGKTNLEKILPKEIASEEAEAVNVPKKIETVEQEQFEELRENKELTFDEKNFPRLI